MDPSLFASTFFLIFLAELPDKTAFATLVLSTKGRPLAIFTGVAAAFLVQSVIAVAFGGLIGLLPEKWVHPGAGVLFLLFAAHSWFFHDQEEDEAEQEASQVPVKNHFWSAAWKSFLVIFMAEWGDLTQLATASLAAKYPKDPLTLLAASTLALWCVTAIAVTLGNHLKKVIHIQHLKILGTVLFAGVGLYFLFTSLPR
jgi:Ca2+/H+ antiporter, TMEM165/GDT1 family